MTNVDTLKKYEATLCFTQHSRAKVVIKAKSLAEAVAKADDIHADEVDDWNPFDGEIVVDTVEPVEPGKDGRHCFFDGASFVDAAEGGQSND